MPAILRSSAKGSSLLVLMGGIVALAAVVIFLESCGNSGSSIVSNGTGTIHVSLTDPPSCAFPNGNYDHVYVTIRSVQANINASADDNSSGWQELTPQLNTQPLQIDLFAAGSNACLLSQLASTTGLPTGSYQQIRLLLVANDGGSGSLPATNACGKQGFNCVVLHDGTVNELQLSSQANTGLKIPPGQIVGGPIVVSPGQDIDLNIDFNACASIVQEGNGQFRLKPVLTAGQVSTNSSGISGQVVDGGTGLPVVGGTVLVALEQLDSSGTDVIFMQKAADSNGNFNFCPLPTGATFDVVAVAINGAGVAYNATIGVGVPGGTNLGAIPLAIETGPPAGPATLKGFLTATTGSAPATVDAAVAALQTITPAGLAARPVTIPGEGTSTTNIAIQSSTGCPATAPLHTNCAQYTLIEPASNPRFGVFSAGKITYSAPAGGVVPYTIRANAFQPLSGGATDCTSSSKLTSLDSLGNPLKVTPSATVTPAEIDFAGCT